MKNIINFIIDQELTLLEDYPSLAQPISEKFGLEFILAESIIDTVIEWESDESINDSLEKYLTIKFPDVVT